MMYILEKVCNGLQEELLVGEEGCYGTDFSFCEG